ncbi:MAG: UDP-N-acetylglucosamine 4,6-dehydratase (inverting) [Candidatus Heimdallarchaeota archaeon LC_2]|nr:MAG: UDP-N-acetylglucosamine 4,6-dehydratase (inverting) [Candidatus Heimdallarchaeota archaeon LC_2]
MDTNNQTMRMTKDHQSFPHFSEIASIVNNKTILVTGGTGSIGSAIVQRLLQFKPKTIRILTNDEDSLFQLSQQLKEHREILRFFLGDIREYLRIKKAMSNVDIVFHAAALKHVEMGEFNPFETIKTNVQGTQNMIESALKVNVDRFVNISTDKAANPLNVMGATKLLCEKLVTAAETWRGEARTKFCSVRFGNVFGSRGSLYTIIKNQIENDQPLTITHPKMTRYLMSINEAVNLIFFALINEQRGEIYVPKMKSIQIDRLINLTAKHLCKKLGKDNTEISVKNTSIKLGEKMHEELVTADEIRYTYDHSGYLIVQPDLPVESKYDWSENASATDDKSYSSLKGERFEDEEIFAMIDEIEASYLGK